MKIDSRTYQSPNYNERPYGTAISSLVIHTTEGRWDSDAKWLCAKKSKVSAHYVISPDGVVYQLVAPKWRAWHAGESYYAGRSDYNDFSIGIEISHMSGEKYGTPQMNSLTELSRVLVWEHSIPAEMVVKHAWIAVPEGRKVDPTDWSDAGFNSWVKLVYGAVQPIDPLKARQIPGLDRPYYCGVGFYDLYYQKNGFWWLGYPIGDETRAVDQQGENCTYMPFQRATLKYDPTEGIRTALESEADALGWNV